MWRPPLKLTDGRHIKYSHFILSHGTNGLPYDDTFIWLHNDKVTSVSRRGSRIFCRGGGGSTTTVYSGRRRPRRRGGGPLGLINIRLRYIASIEYSERLLLFIFFAIVKKFVEKKTIGGREQGGVTTPPPPLDPRLVS